MIEQWYEIRQLTPEGQEKLQERIERGKRIGQLRRERYPNLRDVPLITNRHYGTAFLNIWGMEITGNGGFGFGFDPADDLFYVDHVTICPDFDLIEGVHTYLRMPMKVHGFEDTEDMKLEVIEQAKEALFVRREEVGGREFWKSVYDRLRTGTGLEPIEVKINERDIEIRGSNVYLKQTTTECSQCHTPEWLWNPIALDPEDILYLTDSEIGNCGLGMASGGEGDKETGGRTLVWTPDDQRICSIGCLKEWYHSWGIGLKRESQVREIARRIVGDQSYAYADAWLEREGSNLFWEVNLCNRNLVEERVIRIDTDGNVLEDKLVTSSVKDIAL